MTGATDTNIVEFKRPRYTTIRNWNGRWIVADNIDGEAIDVLDTMEEAQECVAYLNGGVA